MKNIYFILRFSSYLLLFIGIFFVLGSIGSLDLDRITFVQFLLQELFAVLCIFFAYCVYYIKETFREKYLKNIKK